MSFMLFSILYAVHSISSMLCSSLWYIFLLKLDCAKCHAHSTIASLLTTSRTVADTAVLVACFSVCMQSPVGV
jgi:hypothetical protein